MTSTGAPAQAAGGEAAPEPAPPRRTTFTTAPTSEPLDSLRRDHVAAFRPAILGIRGGATAVSVALSAGAFASGDKKIIIWCGIVVAYNVFRIIKPVKFHDDTA